MTDDDMCKICGCIFEIAETNGGNLDLNSLRMSRKHLDHLFDLIETSKIESKDYEIIKIAHKCASFPAHVRIRPPKFNKAGDKTNSKAQIIVELYDNGQNYINRERPHWKIQQDLNQEIWSQLAPKKSCNNDWFKFEYFGRGFDANAETWNNMLGDFKQKLKQMGWTYLISFYGLKQKQ